MKCCSALPWRAGILCGITIFGIAMLCTFCVVHVHYEVIDTHVNTGNAPSSALFIEFILSVVVV